MKTAFASLAFLLLTLSASAAEYKIGPEFLPSYTDKYESKLIVPTGETVTLSGVKDIDAIEVLGTLSVPGELTLKYINLTVAQGGKLVIGTAATPNTSNVEFIKKDVAIDTAFDPFQWGHGIQVFGEWSVHGRKLSQTWSLIQSAEAGGISITLDYVPVDWQVGDSLLIPDTQQMGEYTFKRLNKVRHESPVTIAAINGNAITLSKPLDFEHRNITHQGQVVARPAVANCTRSIVFRSESLANRGHIAVIHTGQCDFRYASIIGMGRTTNEAIDSTSLDLSHIGTNQIAKYAFHAHHVSHHVGTDHGGVHVIGCHADGLNGGKWGIVDHTSPGFHAEENVITGHPGSGLVTEDGNETGYLFKRNFCHGASGNGLNGKLNLLLNQSVGKFAPGAEGVGIWNHSPSGRTIENYCINNVVGIEFIYRENPGKRFIPLIPPIENRDNICISNTLFGVEIWNSPPGFYVDDQVCANNGYAGVFPGSAEPASVILRNPTLVNTKIVRPGEVVQWPYIGSGVFSSLYTDSMVIEGGVASGFQYGLRDATNVDFRNVDARGNGTFDIFFNTKPAGSVNLENVLYDTLFSPDVIPPPPPEVWEPASIGPPFNGDASLRVRNGLIEKLK